MPSVSERLRQPLDESMLLRLVVVSGLMRGSDLARFYAQGGGGLDGSRSLEQYLVASGVDVEQLKILKRAYVETQDFGSNLLEVLRARHADKGRLAAVEKALNACETEQIVKIKGGQPPAPIGEMLVERGLLTREDLELVISRQGLATRIERYASEARERSTLGSRLGVRRLPAFMRGHSTLIAAGVVLAAVVLANLWLAGVFDRPRDAFSRARDAEDHIANLSGLYANMLAELRRRQPENAEHYRGLLDRYFARLAGARIVLDDHRVAHVRRTYPALDFGKLGGLNPKELPGMSAAELERRLARTP